MSFANALCDSFLHRKRLILTCAAMLSFSGVASWLAMPRQEDPTMPNRFGLMVTLFPGADALEVERLVAEPLEEELAQVSELSLVETTARADVVVMQLELGDSVAGVGIEEAWDDVREAIARARREFPEGVYAPDLQTEMMQDQESVVLAVTGSLDPTVLLSGAERLKRRLLRINGVSKVKLAGDPGEQVTIELDQVTQERLALSAPELAAALRGRNQTIPGGAIRIASRSLSVNPASKLDSIEAIAQAPLVLRSGAAVRLEDVATVRYGPEEPASSVVRHQGEPAVVVGVVADLGVNLVSLGEEIRRTVAKLAAEIAPLEVHELSFQPDYVEARLTDLGGSLMLGIGIVAAVLILAMGIRLGAVVASIVPLVAFASLGLYAIGGGVLHQISVAALVIALGMLVDNAIVVAEAIQARIDSGLERFEAAREAVKELAWPLATATGTTLAAFVPMYASSGPTGDFTRAIPIVIMLTLVVSYVFAITVTPTLAAWALRPQPARATRAGPAVWASRIALEHPRRVLAGAVVAVLLSGLGAGFVDAAFFPKAGRDQFVVEMTLPEGSHIDYVDELAARVERHLLDLPDVAEVSTFVGRSAPRFYYNLPNEPNSPHFAHFMLTLSDSSVVDRVANEVRRFNREVLPEAQLIPRPLEQGPPIAAPIEVRLYGDDLGALYYAAEDVMRALDADSDAIDVRQNLGLGRPTLKIAIDDSAAERRGVNRAAIASALFQETRGIEVGQLRADDDPIPIRIRSAAGENATVAALGTLGVPSASTGERIPLQQVAETSVEWKPAAIHRRNGERVMSVLAQLRGDAGYAAVLERLQPTFVAAEWSDQVRVELGGAAEGSGDANSAIATAAPIGALLLLFFLLVEFNSFRRVGIILTTIPLAAAGVVPGLLIADQPFGFMSLLGVIALIGVVVNNAIVLIDVVESRRAAGDSIPDALAHAVALRTRPILLTSVTTIAGLLPLALSSSPLWPPLASAMIAGLFASTFLTLLVVPALYTQLFREVAA